MNARDLSQVSMRDLFRMEAESQTQQLTEGLLALERNPVAADQLEACMRAAHSLKGAARIVDIEAGVALAHAMEDVLLAAQHGRVQLDQAQIDLLLAGVDLMMAIARDPDMEPGEASGRRRGEVDAFIADLHRLVAGETRAHDRASDQPAEPTETGAEPASLPEPAAPAAVAAEPAPRRGTSAERAAAPQPKPTPVEPEATDRVLRVSVDNLNRLLGLAGETLVESRWIKPFGESLLRVKRLQYQAGRALDDLRDALSKEAVPARAVSALAEARQRTAECERMLADRLAEVDQADRQSTRLAHRLYDQALGCRMRPFRDGTIGFARMVRDVARSLGKQVQLDIEGQGPRSIATSWPSWKRRWGICCATPSITASNRPPSASPPASRRGPAFAARSPSRRRVADHRARRRTRHRSRPAPADGGGAPPVDPRNGRQTQRLGAAGVPVPARLHAKDRVTEISGRGVGLDVVQDMVKEVHGVVRIASEHRQGNPLPPAAAADPVGGADAAGRDRGEPYAFPLARIARAVKVPKEQIEVLEGRQHFGLEGQQVGLVTAHQVLGSAGRTPPATSSPSSWSASHDQRYGLVVDRFLGGRSSSSGRSTRGSGRSRTSAPPRCWTTARRC